MLYYFVIGITITLVIILVLSYWLAYDSQSHNQYTDANNRERVKIFRARLAELEQDNARGTVDDEYCIYQKARLERQLIAITTNEEQDSQLTTLSISTLMKLVTALMVLAVGVYCVQPEKRTLLAWFADNDTYADVAEQLMTGNMDTPPGWAIADKKSADRLLISMQANVHAHAQDTSRWMRLADRFVALRLTDAALESIERAMRLEPYNDEYALSYVKLSYIAFDNKLNERAKNTLDELIARTPENQEALMVLVMTSSKSGNLDTAIMWAEKLKAVIIKKTNNDASAVRQPDYLIDTMLKQRKQQQTQN